jgi:WD repeat-containing protein 48
VRVYDPRSKKQVAHLVGHTDMIRKTLLSEDGRWLLSASSDATVKLFSLTNQKCLGTFAVHSTSVFSLFSQHPSLERFYSGDRSGMLCKIDFEGCGDPADGEAVVLARDGDDRIGSGGIHSIVARDDSYVWTAAGSTGIKRWKDIPSRLSRAGALRVRRTVGRRMDSESTDGLLADHQIQVSTPDKPPERDSSGLHSALFLEGLTTTLSRTTSSPTAHFAPHLPVKRPTSLRLPPRPPRRSVFSFPAPVLPRSDEASETLLDIPYSSLVPLGSDDFGLLAHESSTTHNRPASQYSHHQNITEVVTALSESHTSEDAKNYLERVGAIDATPLRSAPDYTIEGDSCGLLRAMLLSDRRHVISVNMEGDVHLWDIVTTKCLGVFERDDVGLCTRRPSTQSDKSVIVETPLSVLDNVKERIEFEGATATYCSIEGRGKITVHLDEAQVFDAEIYADEAQLESPMDYPRDHRLNIGKWILRSLFAEFIEAQIQYRGIDSKSPPSPQQSFKLTMSSLPASTSIKMAADGSETPRVATGSTTPNFISLAGLAKLTTAPLMNRRTPGMTISATPALRPAMPTTDLPHSPKLDSDHLLPLKEPVVSGDSDAPTPTQTAPALDYFSLPPASSTEAPTTPSAQGSSTTPGAGIMGRLRFGRKKTDISDKPAELAVANVTPDIQLVSSFMLFRNHCTDTPLTCLLICFIVDRGTDPNTRTKSFTVTGPKYMPSSRCAYYSIRS